MITSCATVYASPVPIVNDCVPVAIESVSVLVVEYRSANPVAPALPCDPVAPV